MDSKYYFSHRGDESEFVGPLGLELKRFKVTKGPRTDDEKFSEIEIGEPKVEADTPDHLSLLVHYHDNYVDCVYSLKPDEMEDMFRRQIDYETLMCGECDDSYVVLSKYRLDAMMMEKNHGRIQVTRSESTWFMFKDIPIGRTIVAFNRTTGEYTLEE